MFTDWQKTRIANLATTLVKTWNKRGIANTLGDEARALLTEVNGIIQATKPKPYTSSEQERDMMMHRRQGHTSVQQALQKVTQKAIQRQREIDAWERENS